MVQQNALQPNQQKQWLLEYQTPIADICVPAQLITMQGVCAVRTGIFCTTDALTNAGAIAKPP